MEPILYKFIISLSLSLLKLYGLVVRFLQNFTSKGLLNVIFQRVELCSMPERLVLGYTFTEWWWRGGWSLVDRNVARAEIRSRHTLVQNGIRMYGSMNWSLDPGSPDFYTLLLYIRFRISIISMHRPGFPSVFYISITLYSWFWISITSYIRLGFVFPSVFQISIMLIHNARFRIFVSFLDISHSHT